MINAFHIDSSALTLADLEKVLQPGTQIALSPEAKEKIVVCRDYLNNILRDSDDLYYGINTGFGSLCNIRISKEQLEQLQENLVKSHACGIGEEVPAEIVKLMLILKVKGLALGYSGVRLETVERLVAHFNEEVLPVIYQIGSLGASGDLAPLAHLSLPLIGSGEVRVNGAKQDASGVLQSKGWQPLTLKAKEGLALINGTQFMSAYGCYILLKAQRLAGIADLVASLSIDAYDARTSPFNPLIHQVRPFKGQKETAENILRNLEGSPIAASAKKAVQDPYSFRCIPQVHGAAKDVIAHVASVFETEINSVTDNPLIFPEEGEILSGGNFHGQPLAFALDYLALALADMANISERRTYQLIIGWRNLPPFLTEHSGLHSGLMISQYTAAAMVSQNKQLCTPSSIDTITSSAGQEDHVSMGANGATKAYRIMENAERIIAIELMTAAQALDLRRPQKSSPIIEQLMTDYRKVVSYNDKDRELYKDINATVAFLNTLEVK
jgi:histidine ammonia-lyase